MSTSNRFLQIAQQSEELQEFSASKGRKARDGEEVLREAREKHSRYRNFITSSYFKPSGPRIGMSRIQYGDGEFDTSVLELQRYQQESARHDPLPEMQEPVALTRTLSRTASHMRRGAPGQRPKSGVAQDEGRARRHADAGRISSGGDDDDSEEGDDGNAGLRSTAAAPPPTASVLARSSSRSFRGVLDSLLEGTASLSVNVLGRSTEDGSGAAFEAFRSSASLSAAASNGTSPSALTPTGQSFSGASQNFRGLAGSPLRRTPGGSYSGWERWEARSGKALPDAMPAAETSALLDPGDSPCRRSAAGDRHAAAHGLGLHGGTAGGRLFNCRGTAGGGPAGIQHQQHAMQRSSSNRALPVGSMTAPQLMLDLSALDGGDAVVPPAPAPPPSRISTMGGTSGACSGSRGLARTPSRKALMGGQGATCPRGEPSDGERARGSPNPQAAQCAALAAHPPSPTYGSQSTPPWGYSTVPGRGVAMEEACQRTSSPFTRQVDDAVDDGGAATTGSGGGIGIPRRSTGALQTQLGSSPLGSPLGGGSSLFATASVASSHCIGSPAHCAHSFSATQRRSFEVGPGQAARNAVLSGWTSRRSSSRNLLWQQQLQQPAGGVSTVGVGGPGTPVEGGVPSSLHPQPPQAGLPHPATRPHSARISRARLAPGGAHSSPLNGEAGGGSEALGAGDGGASGGAVMGHIQTTALRQCHVPSPPTDGSPTWHASAGSIGLVQD